MKICNKCNKGYIEKTAFDLYCNSCKDEIKNGPKISYDFQNINKVCNKCKRLLPIKQFNLLKIKNGIQNRNDICSVCQSDIAKLANKRRQEYNKNKRRRNQKRNVVKNEEIIVVNKSHLTKEYIDYIRSVEWSIKRKQRLKIDNYKCECGRKAKQVHHLTYKNLFNENMEDLRSLCNICHDKKHFTLTRKY